MHKLLQSDRHLSEFNLYQSTLDVIFFCLFVLFYPYIWKGQMDWRKRYNSGCVGSFHQFPPIAHQVWAIIVNSSEILPHYCYINGNKIQLHHKAPPHTNRIRSIKNKNTESPLLHIENAIKQRQTWNDDMSGSPPPPDHALAACLSILNFTLLAPFKVHKSVLD